MMHARWLFIGMMCSFTSLIGAAPAASPAKAPTPVAPVVPVNPAPAVPVARPITPPPVPTQLPVAPERRQEILDFWFGPLSGDASYPVDRVTNWFTSTPEFDREIREKFEGDLLKAVNGNYNEWRETPKGRLALILLLDQFPRHIYRNTTKAFATDAMARGLATEGIQNGDDLKLLPIERVFFYIPLEHSEDPKLQELSVAKYKELVNQSPVSIQPQMQDFLRYALIHQDVIKQFGRFPGRNVALGRPSTPEEKKYLNQFGDYPE